MDSEQLEETVGVDSRFDQLEEALELLRELARSSPGDLSPEVTQFASLLIQLAELIEGFAEGALTEAGARDPLSNFVLESTTVIKFASQQDEAALSRIQQLKHESVERWGDRIRFDLDADFDELFDGWDHADGTPDELGAEGTDAYEPGDVPSAEDIGRLIAGLGSTSGDSETKPLPEQFAEADDDGDVGEPNGSAMENDPPLEGELKDAFLDDADRCVTSLEEASLTLESHPENGSALQQILRELHTLKGASGSVGLSNLASFIHELEESLRERESSGSLPDIEALLTNVDAIRRRVEEVRSPGQDADSYSPSASVEPTPQRPDMDRQYQPASDPVPSSALAAAVAPATATPVSRFSDAQTDEETVRVKASQLNRLMDMLSQLVMLRNRRGMELADLEEIHHEMIHNVSRMRVLSDEGDIAQGSGGGPGEQRKLELPRVAEIANDLFESAQRLRACYQPVAEGNTAVSQFIRQFRQELVELRRTPVAGLFRRLRRAIRDAARVENKQIELIFVGEGTGIERSLQEKIYEPLLHIVRNCVSHGIEDSETRTQRGKKPAGQVTLAAHSGPDLLVIEVRDDGRGLDYDAIRRRGVERGLLKPDMAPTREELALLIFQPGFSTREVASEIAGRGVGMDVVASVLDRMRGWIQVESEPEAGTTIRLNFPLPSVIQHTMVFRSSGQLFALPMQFVRGAGGEDEQILPVRIEGVLGEAGLMSQVSRADEQGSLLVLDCQAKADSTAPTQAQQERLRVALSVDEIVGPEEVVVRPLPALLKQHPLYTGATLSGMGEIVLVLDAHRLAELATGIGTAGMARQPAVASGVDSDTERLPRVLVTDDSMTARKRLVKSLRRFPVEIVEASDGAEAWELLKQGSYAAVFSDYEMPHVDGFELLSQIKQDPQLSTLPVVIISSRTEDEFRTRAAELGVHDYLGKPIEDDALDGVLQTIPTLQLLGEPNDSTKPRNGETV